MSEKTTLTTSDYEEVLASHRSLVREIDVAMNGAGAAPQASLCDLVPQIEIMAERLRLARDQFRFLASIAKAKTIQRDGKFITLATAVKQEAAQAADLCDLALRGKRPTA